MSTVLNAENLRLVEKQLLKFREEFGVWDAPVDGYRLLRRMSESGKISLRWEETRGMNDFIDGQTRYNPQDGSYMILLKEGPRDWKKYSSRRRFNFTIAHELGHIAFGHLAIPIRLKTEELREFEDAEADAFASRLLMPAEALGQFCSVKEAADALWVSESAVRRRIRDSGLLLAVRTCPRCGFDRIPPAAQYCRMCGESLSDPPCPPRETGVRYLPPAPEECPVCGYKGPSPDGICLNCEYPKRNHCLPEYNQPPHRCPDDARYCEACGAPTLYGELIPQLSSPGSR